MYRKHPSAHVHSILGKVHEKNLALCGIKKYIHVHVDATDHKDSSTHDLWSMHPSHGLVLYFTLVF